MVEIKIKKIKGRRNSRGISLVIPDKYNLEFPDYFFTTIIIKRIIKRGKYDKGERLPKPCKNCWEIFKPKGKFQKLCFKCTSNASRKRLYGRGKSKTS